jgi:hypothetical protein
VKYLCKLRILRGIQVLEKYKQNFDVSRFGYKPPDAFARNVKFYLYSSSSRIVYNPQLRVVIVATYAGIQMKYHYLLFHHEFDLKFSFLLLEQGACLHHLFHFVTKI